jgi:hypothetical protein
MNVVLWSWDVGDDVGNDVGDDETNSGVCHLGMST